MNYDRNVIGKTLTEEYGIDPQFKIFRYAYRNNLEEAKARFIVRVKLKRMNVNANKLFSNLPKLILFRFRGFLAKYWLCNEATGECMGVYHWATYEDAKRYSESIAMRFMKKRSVPGSVTFEITKLESLEKI